MSNLIEEISVEIRAAWASKGCFLDSTLKNLDIVGYLLVSSGIKG